MSNPEDQFDIAPDQLGQLGDVASFAGDVLTNALENEGIRHKAFDILAEKEGCVVGAASLYNQIYEIDYDPTDQQAQINRIKIHNLFNEKQTMGKLFLKMAEEQGYVPQVGTLFIGRDDPDKKPKQKRIYRMFKAENYVPARDNQVMFRGKNYIEWEPTAVKHEIASRVYDDTPPIQSLHKVIKRKPKPPQTPKKAKLDIVPDPNKDDWLIKWKEKVDQTIESVEEDGLMLDGFVKASTIRLKSKSTIMGTDELRRRMRSADLLDRRALDRSEPLTADQIVLMRLFNQNQKLLGQKTPQQKVAVETVLDKVIEHFDRKQSSDSN